VGGYVGALKHLFEVIDGIDVTLWQQRASEMIGNGLALGEELEGRYLDSESGDLILSERG
jgi:hypothetical protein